MKPEYSHGNVRTRCPDCNGAITTYEQKRQGSEFGTVVIESAHRYKDWSYTHFLYRLMCCASCGRGGLAKIHYDKNIGREDLEAFYPFCIENLPIPSPVPNEIETEFREAELCCSFGALRAASALFRSTLEKTLKANGYTKGTLEGKIDEAAVDGVITEGRKQRAHEDIRVLGNDVLHDDWRAVSEDEVEDSHRYTQRILEDLYDDRKSVLKILVSKGRLSSSP
jgi:hypothetical protein